MAGLTSLEDAIEQGARRNFLLRVVGLCGLVAMIDGFDTQSIGIAAPEIAADWGVAPAGFGLVFGAGLFGGLLGALLFGAIADRLGRKPTLLAAVFLMGVATLTTPYAGSLPQLAAIRFITGIGLGGAIPAIIALTAEYAPTRLRATLVGVMFCGFPFGAVVGGAICAKLIPAFGWQSIFYLGSIAPLALLPALMLFVPESARFLARKNPQRLEKIVADMGWAGRWNGAYAPHTEQKASVRALFSDGLAGKTLRLWATLFCSLMLAYFLVHWIPILARSQGADASASILAISALNFGGIVGSLILNRLVDRTGSTKVVSVAFACGAILVALLGQVGASGTMLILVASFAGGCVLGAQICAVSLCPGFYHTGLRATAVGWSMAAARCGAIAGPMIGGVLLGLGFGAPALLAMVAIVPLVAAITIAGLRPSQEVGRNPLPRPVAAPDAAAG